MEPFHIEDTIEPNKIKTIVIGVNNTENIVSGLKLEKKLSIKKVHATKETTADINQNYLEEYQYDIVFILSYLDNDIDIDIVETITKVTNETKSLTLPVLIAKNLDNIPLERIKKISDSVILISDAQLSSSPTIISDIINTIPWSMHDSRCVDLNYANNDITVDFWDIFVVMRRGITYVGLIGCMGQKATQKAVEALVKEFIPINRAQGLFINFKINQNFPMIEIANAIEIIHETASEDADVIFSTFSDETLPMDYTKAIIFVTGLDNENCSLWSHFKTKLYDIAGSYNAEI